VTVLFGPKQVNILITFLIILSKPMERDYFANMSYCELVITSDEVEPSLITNKIKIEPTSSYSKGEIFTSLQTGKVNMRYQNLWSLKSDSIISEKEDLTSHLLYFEKLFKDKLDVISEIKKSAFFEVSFWIWIETEDAGIGLDLQSENLSFITQISSRVHITILTNRKIE
jgi:hypothetical protein